MLVVGPQASLNLQALQFHSYFPGSPPCSTAWPKSTRAERNQLAHLHFHPVHPVLHRAPNNAQGMIYERERPKEMRQTPIWHL